MASGDVVGIIYRVNLPRTLFAQPATRLGASSPAEQSPKYDFDDTTNEFLDLFGQMSDRYSGGGITVHLKWSAKSATSGTCIWGAAFRRVADGAEDLDVAHTYDYNEVTGNPTTNSGEVMYNTITFTSGADMDSVTANDMFILRIRRNAASDSMSGDAELLGIVVLET